MAFLEFRVDGEKVLSRNLRIIADDVWDMQKELWQIGELVRVSARENIDRWWSETGGKWKPLSQRTQEMRAKGRWYYRNAPSGASASGPILKWTWKMQNAFKSEPESLQVTISNPTLYFKYHQSKERDSGRLPRRLMLELSQTDKMQAMSILAKWLNKKLAWWNYGRQF